MKVKLKLWKHNCHKKKKLPIKYSKLLLKWINHKNSYGQITQLYQTKMFLFKNNTKYLWIKTWRL